MKGDRRDDEPPDDLGDVMREEMARGRRPTIDTAARRRQQRLKATYRELLRSNPSETEMRAALSDLGHEPGTPGFESLLRQWRTYARGIGRS